MKYRNLLLFLGLLFFFIYVNGQTTNHPYIRNSKGPTIDKIILTNSEMLVYIHVQPSSQRGAKTRFSSGTIWWPGASIPSELKGMNIETPKAPYSSDPYVWQAYKEAVAMNIETKKMFSGVLITSLGTDKLDSYYNIYDKSGNSGYYQFIMHFPKPQKGCEEISIIELCGSDYYYWEGIKINNPYPTVPKTNYTESSAKSKIDEQNDGIVGIYEQVGDESYTLACIKEGETYKLIFLRTTNQTIKAWHVGEVKAILRPSASSGLFKCDWYMGDKTMQSDCYIAFDGSSMKTIVNGSEDTYLKMYPNSSSSAHSGEWGGTGFALNNGYIVTNHHVIDGANTIEILGVKGDFNIAYKATVVATDINNDLALLKISDNRFTGFGTIPYKVKTTQSEVGESISVLGYPLTSTMGDEIKLTTGVISSKTGFQGDVSLYQISAAVQPGNSGGPLFDNYGNIIGIVSSKHTGAENVGYAVKATYLRNLVESYTNTSILPSNTSLSGLTLPEKVKKSKNYIFMIRCK